MGGMRLWNVLGNVASGDVTLDCSLVLSGPLLLAVKVAVIVLVRDIAVTVLPAVAAGVLIATIQTAEMAGVI